MFSCEYLENFKNIFFYGKPPVAVSVNVQRFGIISAFMKMCFNLSIEMLTWFLQSLRNGLQFVLAKMRGWSACVSGVLAWLAC